MSNLGTLPYPRGSLHTLFRRETDALRYLDDYLAEIGASSMLHEKHYVDRHHLDDFASHYARSFAAHGARCERLHFFSIEEPELSRLLAAAYRGEPERARVEKRLQASYLGFVVKRGIVGAEVGRTVLRTYPLDAGGKHQRQYEVVRRYEVNVGGLRLRVNGLAYQQQDGGVAVCASTALWSALQQVARLAGHRTPTPSAVTAAAESPFPPAHGLDYRDMARALARLGYAADQFAPGGNRELFRAKLVTCLESHLPVVLMITRRVEGETEDPTTGHAITLTGFTRPLPTGKEVKLSASRGAVWMPAAAASVIYVHDDNLGSHAHYELWNAEDPLDSEAPANATRDGASDDATVVKPDYLTHKGFPSLMLYRGNTAREKELQASGKKGRWLPDNWIVEAALVPKPEKLRLSLDGLFGTALGLQRVLNGALAGTSYQFRLRYALGVDYGRSLIHCGFKPATLRQFHAALSLPRYIGIVEVFLRDTDEALCEFVVDATDAVAKGERAEVLAVVCRGMSEGTFPHRELSQFAPLWKCPVIAPPAITTKRAARQRLKAAAASAYRAPAPDLE